jgi:hypothetical protein
MALQVIEPELKHGKKANRARANNDNIGLYYLAHVGNPSVKKRALNPAVSLQDQVSPP